MKLFFFTFLSILSLARAAANGGCLASEYCCPDAAHCLTPSNVTCDPSGPESQCGGATCCRESTCRCADVCQLVSHSAMHPPLSLSAALTKLCVTVGRRCTSPCAAKTEYCCPDAKHCLTPAAPVPKLCSAAAPCVSGQVCCPLTKICVIPGTTCDPTHEGVAEGPFGTYCGGMSGIIDDVKLSVVSASRFNVSAKIFGQQLGCYGEPYQWISKTGAFELPGLTNSSDCITKIATSSGLSPSDLEASYGEDTDVVTVNAMGEQLLFTKASC